jgi:hypothetical protein
MQFSCFKSCPQEPYKDIFIEAVYQITHYFFQLFVSRSISTIKGELIPYLVKRQFKRMQEEPADADNTMASMSNDSRSRKAGQFKFINCIKQLRYRSDLTVSSVTK